MAKYLPYFQFEPAEYLTGDISFCSLSAQGLFVNICAYYWQRECQLSKDQLLRRLNHENEFNELVNEGVICVENDEISIKFLDSQFQDITDTLKSNSDKGRIGNLKRWHPNIYKKYTEGKLTLNEACNIAKESPPDNLTNRQTSHIREDKIREDKIREEERETRAFDFLKINNPVRFETEFQMRFSNKIKNKEKFVADFNDKVDVEEIEFTERKLFARLSQFARNWVQNQDKFQPEDPNKNTTSNIPIG